jgi:hypothetical protein
LGDERSFNPVARVRSSNFLLFNSVTGVPDRNFLLFNSVAGVPDGNFLLFNSVAGLPDRNLPFRIAICLSEREFEVNKGSFSLPYLLRLRSAL